MATQPSPATAGILKIPRVLIVDAVVTASASLFPSLLTIPSDADFEWWWTSASRTDSRLKVLITESATQRALIFSGATQISGQFLGVLIDNWAGLISNNAAFPIAVPYVMPAARSYQFLFTDTSGATNTVQIALHGFALIKVSASS